MKLSEFYEGQTVFHPVYGELKVVNIFPSIKAVTVLPKDSIPMDFWESDNCLLISHLYPKPVYICTKHKYILTDGRGMQEYTTEYKPVNTE